VGTVEALAVPALREYAHGAVFFGDGDTPIAPGVSPLGRDQSALRIKIETVRPAARLAIDGRLAGGRAIAHDPIADIAEINAKLRPARRPLGELTFAPQLFQLGPGWNDGILRSHRRDC